MNKQRIYWIDIAKGFCMLAVVLGHFHKPEWDFLYSFHLTVFFILSGYTMKNTPVTKEYIKSKFQRLMVPYFVTCFIVTIVELINMLVIDRVSTIVSATAIVYKNILRGFFASGGQRYFGEMDFGKGIGAIWFLPAMFFAVLIMQIILNSFKHRYKIIIASLSIFVSAALIAKTVWMPFSFLAGVFAVPFIYFGKLLKEVDFIESKLKWYHTVVLGAIFVIGCSLGYGGNFYIVSCSMKDWLFTPILALSSSLVVIGIAKFVKRFPPLEFIGKNSLYFLCAHLVEMNTFYPYYSKLYDFLGITEKYYIIFIIRVLIICLLVGVVLLTKKAFSKFSSNGVKVSTPLNNNRDSSIDVLRSLLIMLMIVGHCVIDRGFRNVIYSFHMMAFVMISGYFYKPGIPFFKNLKKTIKSLLPYLIFSMLYIIVTQRGWFNELLTVIGGISFTKNIFTSLTTVGPVYFILLLFVTKVLYMFINLFKKEWIINLSVIILLCFAMFLGEKGLWLPWSVDCAMFSVIFYHIGYYLKKYKILDACKSRPYIYFVLSPIWVYMVHMVPMEISVRRYGVNVGLTIIGVVSAFIVTYLLCNYLNDHLPQKLLSIITLIGQSTPQILVLHTLFSTKIINFIHNNLGMDRANVYCLITAIFVQVLVSVLVFVINKKMKLFIKTKKSRLTV